MKVIILIICVLIPLCWACGGQNERERLDLSGPWEVIDSAAENPRELPARVKGPAIGIPGDWRHLLERNDDLAAALWLVKKVNIGDDLAGKLLVLSLGPVAVSDRAYFNGHFIGSTGCFPSKDGALDIDFQWSRNRVYSIPAALVKPGGENIIALRVFSHYVNGIRDEPVLYTLDEWNRRNYLRNNLPSFSDFTPIALSILLMVIFVIIIKGSGFRLMNLYMLAFFLSVLAINLLLLGFPVFDDNTVRFKYFLGLYALIDFLLVMSVQEFFRMKITALTALFAVALAVVQVLVFLAPTTRFLVYTSAPFVYALVILCILYSVAIFIRSFARDPRRYWYLSVPVLFIVLSAARTLYTMMSGQLYRMSFSFALHMPALLTGIVLVYIFDLKNIRRERDSLAKTLMKRTKELRRVSRLIPRTEVKPEPREMIRDVVDYLDDNFNETYDRKKLAERFGLNEDYMGQVFKRVVGTNIANYINVKRIDAAKQLLRETDSKVIDIAFHVGFDNLTYFYRLFNRETGRSPVEYRREGVNAIVLSPGE